ncbi:dephospho-CoA kinase [Hoeflea sp. G2-23]|uniref:Dephospho-CoA kinase n=1 Tax=Hoeflea algicola TaxID=2983763 RepID=A0ABT3ZCM3_9HYPH|nr:dephospho-CoA kinase [Hoeflea algicola]MCY0149059.1 dephospho-CoA kinase [Hoeflea algicola]
MIVIGLTGSIGMGKSTTAEMFSDAGIPVISADEIVHELYRGEAVQPIEAAFPGATVDGAVDREALSRTLLADPAGFKRLEAIIHPLVRAREQAFVDQARADGHAMVLVDIPLLYETGAENRVDVVVVVTCDADIQRQRVMARPGMTVEKFEAVLARQVPDAEKRARADHIIDTGQGLEPARRQVADIIAALGASKQG